MPRWKILSGALAVVLLVVLALGTVGHLAARPAKTVKANHGKVRVLLSSPKVKVSASIAGLPMWANYRLIPVWTQHGLPMYVNASVMPALFFDASNPAPAEYVLTELTRLSGPHPLVLIAAGFPKESLGVAEAQVAKLSTKVFHGEPVLLLQGPWTTFARSLPAFAYMGRSAKSAVVVSAARGVGTRLLAQALDTTLAGRGGVPVKPSRKGKGSKK